MPTRRIAAAALTAVLTAMALASAHAGPYRAPRTPDGQPQLQGLWTANASTRLERPPGAPAGFTTKAEELAYEKAAMARIAEGGEAGLGQGASEWQVPFPLGRLDGRLRTGWITDPADGLVPYRPEAKLRQRALAAATLASANPEDRTPSDRCLVGGQASANPPMLNTAVAGGKRIVQTRDAVVILSEMNHDVRIIRLIDPKTAKAAHLPPNLRPWMGDSIGHWEGETLVVETTNLNPGEGDRGLFLIGPDARVTERFTRTAPDEIRYAFEVEDPATYTTPWRGEMPLHPDKGPIFEFACHEGNYSMPLMLQIARAADKGQ
ncbi:hypothetical protein [Phenylobacterium sp.]|uniref:hypothetical protein n=1 Tax=Phenylobacterium sp. TaxID=1871053 RepID=UPI0011F516BB|nr:hypothetical protein [Phenylobacterium sp.]THD50563.1 MAG: hypothetical protein E8A12_22335 [Phenylobacterium sp.]